MRSRFSAFALAIPEYLFRTLHPDQEDRSRDRDEVLRELRAGIAAFKYMRLEVLETREPDAEGIARVLFVARVFERGQDRSFAEVSDFLHDGVGWRYLSGSAVLTAELSRDARTLTIDEFPL
jgi:SEC-C motif-containing protein